MPAALSSRGARALQPALAYFEKHLAGARDLHSPTNERGFVLFTVAENRCNADAVLTRLAAAAPSVPPSATAYDNFIGRESFQRAFSQLMQSSGAVKRVLDPSHLVVQAGCGALINALGFLLLNAGDAIILPTPTYGALYNDFAALAQVHVQDCPTSEAEGFWVTPAALELAASVAEEGGHPVKALLLINPHNPTGRIAPVEELQACIAWARARGLHTIVDEIYANSCWDGEDAFVSAADFCAAADDVHVLWGASKDLGLSGIRVGALYTDNAQLLQCMGNVGYFASASNFVQDALAEVLSDTAWSLEYLAANNRILSEAYRTVTAGLRTAGLPFFAAQSGMFVWVDLRSLLPPGDASDGASPFGPERRLVQQLYDEERVLLTPGEACHASEPGFFRLCTAWMPAESTAVGLQRLAAFAARHKR
jgi:aspartate/methionine/tyrosine aminotransferase